MPSPFRAAARGRLNPASYYANAVTNHYARIVHATEAGGLGCASRTTTSLPPAASTVGSGVQRRPALPTVTLGAVH